MLLKVTASRDQDGLNLVLNNAVFGEVLLVVLKLKKRVGVFFMYIYFN
jgi:hypothetical protein